MIDFHSGHLKQEWDAISAADESLTVALTHLDSKRHQALSKWIRDNNGNYGIRWDRNSGSVVLTANIQGQCVLGMLFSVDLASETLQKFVDLLQVQEVHGS